MPEFAYIAVDPKGREKRGTVKATNDADARAGLEARKLYVVKVKPQAAASGADIEVAGLKLTRARRLSAKQLTLFTRQLATLSQVHDRVDHRLRLLRRRGAVEIVPADDRRKLVADVEILPVAKRWGGGRREATD